MPERPWTCQKCGKLLAMVNEQAIAIRISEGRGRKQSYEARLPASARCRCGAQNEMPAKREGQENGVRR